MASATPVEMPPRARSLVSSAPKFHVPFLALLARLTPPLYIVWVSAWSKRPTVRGAVIWRSMRHASGRVAVASSPIALKSWLALSVCSLSSMAGNTTTSVSAVATLTVASALKLPVAAFTLNVPFVPLLVNTLLASVPPSLSVITTGSAGSISMPNWSRTVTL